ncbi:hypothetical protein NQ314_003628 [Rhamnusium bicolor]|uniref:Homeobox domain-containing protein n=1 Tax=Rhamnusium bicolor TaxID=1586634 RepID=A0AAV8ZLM2_9CUCU|nr:hypothetical protein NQ314_003628 [Rhamnusium bicolor]
MSVETSKPQFSGTCEVHCKTVSPSPSVSKTALPRTSYNNQFYTNIFTTEEFKSHEEYAVGRKRVRTVFTAEQLQELERHFYLSKYAHGSTRGKLAQNLNLTEKQVKTWFKNRRMKFKKEMSSLNNTGLPEEHIITEVTLEDVLNMEDVFKDNNQFEFDFDLSYLN